jgi:beta-glucanase (GH16 family)
MIKKIFLLMSFSLLTIALVACELSTTDDKFDKIFDEVMIIYQDNDKSGSVRYDLGLPDFSDISPDAILTWSSSHPSVVSSNGQVTRPEKSMWVLLILTVSLGEESQTKQFPIYVLSSNDDASGHKTYEVTFSFNNGEPAIVVTVIENQTVDRPVNPTREGFQFMYWLLDSEIYDFDQPINSDISLYAHYEFESKDGRKLTFYDDFEGDALDLTKWEYQEGTGVEYGIWGWGNSEKQFYTRDNIEVSNGMLIIHAKQETGRTSDSHFQYTSGKIVSYETNNSFRNNPDGFRQTYGRFEARIKAPLGDGFWPAFWLMPAENSYGNGWPYNGEIDIVELRGRKPFEITSAVHFSNVGPHYGGYNGGHHSYLHQNYIFTSGASIDQFNVYAVEWQPGKIEFSVNDIVYHTRLAGDFLNYDGFSPFDQPFYIIINLAVGGHFDGFRTPNPSDFPAKLEVDWVRVYDGIGN